MTDTEQKQFFYSNQILYFILFFLHTKKIQQTLPKNDLHRVLNTSVRVEPFTKTERSGHAPNNMNPV